VIFGSAFAFGLLHDLGMSTKTSGAVAWAHVISPIDELVEFVGGVLSAHFSELFARHVYYLRHPRKGACESDRRHASAVRNGLIACLDLSPSGFA